MVPSLTEGNLVPLLMGEGVVSSLGPSPFENSQEDTRGGGLRTVHGGI